MIKFWTYKKEYKKIKKEILKNIDSTISKDQYFWKRITNLRKNFLKNIIRNMGQQWVVELKHY